ncbi:kinase-like domain-containing protein [Scleroderma yunnanense]
MAFDESCSSASCVRRAQNVLEPESIQITRQQVSITALDATLLCTRAGPSSTVVVDGPPSMKQFLGRLVAERTIQERNDILGIDRVAFGSTMTLQSLSSIHEFIPLSYVKRDMQTQSLLMPPEQLGQNSSSPSNYNRSNMFGELQSVVDQRFTFLDLEDRVFRSEAVRHGGSSVVYEGILSPEQTKVAVKTAHHYKVNAVCVLKRALREVYIWSKLKHSNVIELLGITTAFDHTISIVSPWMSKGDAFDYVQDPDVDPCPLILGIANGLHYLHTYEQGIIHGNLKGPNVLVSDDGHALLTDFNFSHVVEATFALAREQCPGGTLPWMPPEYLAEDLWKMSTAGDVWSFGMTVLELFTRKRPFEHLNTIPTIMVHIVYKKFDRPNLDASYRLTDEWWDMCLLCWKRDPPQRPPMLSVIEKIRTLQPKPKVVGHSLPRNHVSTHQMDTRTALKQFAERASRYAINLDGLVSRDDMFPFWGGSSVVSSGILQLKEENFLEEVYVWSKLDHANVLPLLGITTEFDLTVSIIVPWMEKGNAHDYVQNKDVDPRPLIEGIAKGLNYLHNCEPSAIFHGDVKGVNVLISDNGQALLTDFGLSTIYYSTFAMTFSDGRGVGTLRWMSPEILKGGEVSAEADVWAFAMTALVRLSLFHIRSVKIETITKIMNMSDASIPNQRCDHEAVVMIPDNADSV